MVIPWTVVVNNHFTLGKSILNARPSERVTLSDKKGLGVTAAPYFWNKMMGFILKKAPFPEQGNRCRKSTIVRRYIGC